MTMYRPDRHGNQCEVEKYCCGSCANYDFRDDDDSNRCTEFGKYYYKDDSCRGRWEESSECR